MRLATRRSKRAQRLKNTADLVRILSTRYLGASSMWAWRFTKMQHVAQAHGWTKFVSMQDQYNLLQREEERKMFGVLTDQGVGAMPWSPLAAGKVTRSGCSPSAPSRSATKPHHLADAVAALDVQLTDDEVAALEEHYTPRQPTYFN